MDKSLKILLYVIAAVTIINLLSNLFGSNKLLKSALEKLNSAEQKLDNATGMISGAQKDVQSMQLKIDTLNIIITDAQRRVEKIDLEKRLTAEHSKAEQDTIKARLVALKDSIPEPGADIFNFQTITLKKPKK